MATTNYIPGSERRFLRGLRFAALVAIVLIAVISVYAVIKFQNYKHDSRLVEQQNQVQRTLTNLSDQLGRAEVAQLRYLISSETELYTPYHRAKRNAYQLLNQARQLVQKDQVEAYLLDSIAGVMDKRFELLEQAARLDSISLHQTDFKQRLIDEGYSTSYRVNQLVEEIQSHSEQKLKASREETRVSFNEAVLFVFVLSGVTIIIVAISSHLVFTEFRQRIYIEQDLHQNRTLLNTGEQLAFTGSFRYNMATNRFTWSKGFRTVFGFDKENQPYTLEQFLKRVAREDQKKVLRSFKAFAETPGTQHLNFKIHRSNDGALRYIKMQNSVLESQNEISTLVMGSVSDKTEEEQNREKLLQLNRDLRESNSELERFAYAASHDLQEPLRKIISFGDRLFANYGSNAPGHEYVQRIQKASLRMKRLIDDLLRLSRISQSPGEFEKIDLNKLIEDVIEDLSIKIAEIQAKVKYGQLPIVYGNQSQIHQLFLNLVSNGLKFSKASSPPRIKITSEVVKTTATNNWSGGNQVQTSPLHHSAYYRIVVTDNGIGFEPDSLERIFRVFERLHGRSQYEGTGIGLAICQSIVEKHDGSITAESTPGKGSEFIIYLPVINETFNHAPHPHKRESRGLAHP